MRHYLVATVVCLAYLMTGGGLPGRIGTSHILNRPAQQGGTAQICVALFDDLDEDSLWTQGEPLLAGGTFSLSGPVSGMYTTDGVSEPYCFTGLTAGEYVVSVVPPPGYYLTSLERIPVTLSGSSGEVRLSFGAALQGQNSPQSGGQQAVPVGGSNVRVSTVLIVVAVAAIVLVAVGAGAGVFLLIYRRGR
jgi:hypothetical protein